MKKLTEKFKAIFQKNFSRKGSRKNGMPGVSGVPRVILYIIIFLVVFFVFTIIFFPYNSLKKPIELSIYNNTGLKTDIKSVSPAFPYGLNLNGVKFLEYSGGNTGTEPLAEVKNIRINNIISLLADYEFFGKIPINLSLDAVKIYPVKSGFINIPRLNLKKIGVDLLVMKTGSKAKTGMAQSGALTGYISFIGDLTGSLVIKNANFEPVLIIQKGTFSVKPDKKVYGKFSMLFSTLFQRGKNGYFTYDINNLVL